VEQALAASLGEPTTLPACAERRPVRITPVALAVLQGSGLGGEEVERLLARLADTLGDPDTVGRLVPWAERPGYRLYRTVVGTRKVAHVLTFVLDVAQGEGGVLVVACDDERRRLG
jgi:hypothetical protein